MKLHVTILMVAVTAAAAGQPTPKIVCDKPVYDFGAVDNTKTVDHTFVIHNRGNTPLQIRRVRACCGASTEIAEKLIPPGTNTTLRVKYSLRGRKGKLRKNILIESNDPKHRHYAVTLTGTAAACVAIQPRVVNFGRVSCEKEAERTVRVSWQTNVEFRITSVASTVDRFAATYETTGRTSCQVMIKTVPPLPKGVTRGQVRILSDNPKFRQTDISVMASVASDILVVPQEIRLVREAGRTDPLTRRVVIRSRSRKAFNILKVECPVTGVEVQHEAMGVGQYKMEIANIMPFVDLDGKSVVITTDHDGSRKIEIPIHVESRASGAAPKVVGRVETAPADPGTTAPVGVGQAARLPTQDTHKEAMPDVSAAEDVALVPREIRLKEAPDTSVTCYALLRSRSKKAFKILDVQTPRPDEIEVTYEAFAFGQYRLKISNILPSADLDGKRIIITTNHKKGAGKVEVPIRVIPAASGQ